jgi:hypothetical protein
MNLIEQNDLNQMKLIHPDDFHLDHLHPILHQQLKREKKKKKRKISLLSYKNNEMYFRKEKQ